MKKIIILLIFLQMCNLLNAQWTKINSSTTVRLNDILFTDANTGYIVGDSGTILKTNDGGTTWVKQNSGTNENLNSLGKFSLNSGIEHVYASGGTFLKTIDGGENWSIISTDFISDFTFTDSITGFGVANNYKILKTTDGGLNWININTNFGYDNYFCAIEFSTKNIGIAIGRMDRYLSDVYQDIHQNYGILYKTNNGGQTWEYFNYLPHGTNSWYWQIRPLTSVCFLDSISIYLVCGTKVYYTLDGGLYWEDQYLENIEILQSIYFFNREIGYAVGRNGTVFKTTNAGENWNKMITKTHSDLNKIIFINKDTGFIVGSGGTILKTTNGGEYIPAIEIKYYPNPVFNFLTIENSQKNYALSIMDMNGIEKVKLDVQDFYVQIDLTTLTSGIYILKIINNDDVTIKKIMKL